MKSYTIRLTVKIKNRNEILKDVIKEGKKHPKNWRAVFGKDEKRLSRDYYLFNPDSGVYLLKEYEKNPFVTKGVGGKIARYVDQDIETKISKYSGDFGIIQGDFSKIYKNIEKGVKPEKIYNAALKGKKDYGLTIPIKGHASSSSDIYNGIRDILSKKQKTVDTKFEKIASEDGLYNSYD